MYSYTVSRFKMRNAPTETMPLKVKITKLLKWLEDYDELNNMNEDYNCRFMVH